MEGRPLCNICICLNQPGKADIVGPTPSWLVETIVVITMKLVLMAVAVLFVLISRTSRLNMITIKIIEVWSISPAGCMCPRRPGTRLGGSRGLLWKFRQSWEVLDRFSKSLAFGIVQVGWRPWLAIVIVVHLSSCSFPCYALSYFSLVFVMEHVLTNPNSKSQLTWAIN